MKEMIIKVTGMVCSGCENRVKNAIESMEGIEAVVANHTKGIVEITTKEEVTQKDIEEKIEDIGFTVVKE